MKYKYFEVCLKCDMSSAFEAYFLSEYFVKRNKRITHCYILYKKVKEVTCLRKRE